jgi:AcrR family transcriptional regulator
MSALISVLAELQSGDPVPDDGRRRRSQQSRDRIVAAIMGLVEEGAITPSAEDVAARAGVGLRSVFRHFKDMESLYGEMAARLAKVYAAGLAPFESRDWPGLIAEITDRRLAIFERLLPFKRAADAHRHESATIEAQHDVVLVLLRQRLLAVLPHDLAADAARVEALDMLLSADCWARLRVQQRLDVPAARAVIERLLAGVIA